MTKDELQEIKDSWLTADIPRNRWLPFPLAQQDIRRLVAEVDRLWAYKERVTQAVLNQPMPTF